MKRLLFVLLTLTFIFGVGTALAQTALPPHAVPGFIKGTWQCERGYAKKFDACVEVVLPDSATLNALGNAGNAIADSFARATAARQSARRPTPS